MIKSDFNIRALCNKIAKYDSFALYGAGYVARLLIEYLAEEGRIPQYCIVTGIDGNAESIGNVPVYAFEQKADELRKGNIFVIVSVLQLHEQEIIDLLRQNEIVNVTAFSEYCHNFEMLREVYINQGFNWYVSKVKDWYFERNGQELDDSTWLHSKKQDHVLLVLEHPSPRAVKMIKALKGAGKQILVFINKQKAENPMYALWCNSLKSESCHYYGSVEELIYMLVKNKGMAIHVFSAPWGAISVPYILVRLQADIGKVVFDEYDIANGFYTIVDERTLSMERYCLENAAGICYREFSIEPLTDDLNFDIKGKAIRFFDYCSLESSMAEKGRIKEENGLSLCYAGGINIEEEYPDIPWVLSMAFIEMCEKNGCCLHIYPPDWNEEKYKKYIEKDKGSNYFYFHKPVCHDALSKEMSIYDYGIIMTYDDVWEKEAYGYATKDKCLYFASNKLFDYLDAGLPIIAAVPLKMVEYLEEMGVLLKWTNGQYDFDYLAAVKEEMRARVPSAREKLRIDNHIGELWEFYESL